LVGTWELESVELRDSAGQVVYPLGEHPKGFLIYGQDGHMGVCLTREGRTLFSSGDMGVGTEKEKTEAFDTFVSYFGRYEMLDHDVLHQIKASLFPNWTGTVQRRHFKFEEDRLVLTSEPYVTHGRTQVARVVWKRPAT
jgi:hypothetical protein